jgi:hypothetical protein
MKSKNILIAIFLTISTLGLSFEAKLKFTTVPSTAKIYFDGQLSGTGVAEITLERAILVEVKIVNEGYITFSRSYRYGKGSQFAKNEGKGGYERGKNEYTITLDVDPNYVSPTEKENQLNKLSTKTDSINKFISLPVNSKISPQDSWKIVKQIISDYFDDNDETKPEEGTLKTAWQSQVVDNKKIRTRIIVKTNTDNSYKIKVQSEYSNDISSSVKDDEKFQEWDRMLRKYESTIKELSFKLK